MLSAFERRADHPESDTFNDRVHRFWDWFQESAPELTKAFDTHAGESLGAITSAVVNDLFPGFAWVYGLGDDREGHSFTLSGEGVEHRQLLAQHWLALAPEIAGWTFHAARQAGSLEGGIRMGPHQVNFKEIWMTPHIDEEEEHVDVTIWHPLWPVLEQSQKVTIAFLALDEALGEYGTRWWIGEIRLEGDRLAGSFPLAELPEYVDELSRTYGWKKFLPGSSFTLFKIQPWEKQFPRSDIFLLTTGVPELIHAYRTAQGEMEDILADLGADYVFVSGPSGFLPEGKEAFARGSLADAVEASLLAAESGRCVGGGQGTKQFYIDFLIYDGEESIAIIVRKMRELGLPEGTSIDYFAKEKRGLRVVL